MTARTLAPHMPSDADVAELYANRGAVFERYAAAERARGVAPLSFLTWASLGGGA